MPLGFPAQNLQRLWNRLKDRVVSGHERFFDSVAFAPVLPTFDYTSYLPFVKEILLDFQMLLVGQHEHVRTSGRNEPAKFAVLFNVRRELVIEEVNGRDKRL